MWLFPSLIEKCKSKTNIIEQGLLAGRVLNYSKFAPYGSSSHVVRPKRAGIFLVPPKLQSCTLSEAVFCITLHSSVRLTYCKQTYICSCAKRHASLSKCLCPNEHSSLEGCSNQNKFIFIIEWIHIQIVMILDFIKNFLEHITIYQLQ